MTRNSMSNLEPFDLEIEKTFRCLQNIVETKASSQKQKKKMEETPAYGAAIGIGAGIGARLE